MREFRYLPYEREMDDESSMWVLTGRDARGDDFGIGTAKRIEEAEVRLRLWVLDALLGAAADGEDQTGDLLTEPPGGPAVAFTVLDLFPVKLRVLRVRHGLTQAQMGERLGESQQAYAKLERPGANPTLRTVQQLENAVEEDLLKTADETLLQPRRRRPGRGMPAVGVAVASRYSCPNGCEGDTGQSRYG